MQNVEDLRKRSDGNAGTEPAEPEYVTAGAGAVTKSMTKRRTGAEGGPSVFRPMNGTIYTVRPYKETECEIRSANFENATCTLELYGDRLEPFFYMEVYAKQYSPVCRI